jgi:probable biosynthetic protein (TIGR04099 family)
MNSPLRPIEVKHLLGGCAIPLALPDVVVMGMPHLCLVGLSETWLLKECGHRHWFLLAEAAGLSVPDFREAAGDPIYAAFVAVTVRGANFDAVREHDALAFSSRISRISRTRFTSFHRLAVRGRPVGEIAMTSVFVKRTQAGRNRSIARVEVPGLPPVEADPSSIAFATEIAPLRRDHWVAHLGFERDKAAALNRLVVDPCPAQDFNGADFLYFASYQTFVDRAEWAFFRSAIAHPTTRRRDIVYHGNIEPGERVVVTLLQLRQSDGVLGHWCRVEREEDGSRLADVFTLRG